MSSDLAGIKHPGTVYVNPSVPELVELAISRGEGLLTETGALVATTGARTGRSPKDRFLVSLGDSKDQIDWTTNQPIEPGVFDALQQRVRDHFEGRDLFVIDAYIGADPAHRIKLRVITELAWHALFGRQLFRRPTPEEMEGFEPEFVLLSAPTFEAVPDRDGTNSEAFVGLDLERKQVLICGTLYAGEMKKSMFSSGNYLFPINDGVLGMHCSSNLGADDGVALFFGLSGTGKTTLSADPERRLIGDDEHGWSDDGVFNFEGGCYAKCINLSVEKEPQIWNAIGFGSVVENVVMDEDTRVMDYDDASLTENTRAAYPLELIPGFVPEGRSGHARTIVFLTADAFGVLPPIAKLSREAAMYHFLSGFTSKLAGTEAGLGEEPQATFSTCFGAPFLPLPAGTYAAMLGDRIDRHDAEVYLVNTGWTGGPYGVGKRMDLNLTRAMVGAATQGLLRGVETTRHPIFNVDVPVSCPGVPDDVLDPQSTWEDKDAYEIKARELAGMFADNFERFRDSVPPEVAKAGPSAD